MSLMPLGLLSQGGGGGTSANALTLISSQILTSTASTVTFSSIVGSYKHLQLRMIGRDTGNPGQSYLGVATTVNGDTATNYDLHVMLGQGTSVVSSASNTRASVLFYGLATAYAASNVFTGGIMDILDYSNTSKNKTFRTFSGIHDTQSAVYLSSGLWRSTAAISSITLTAPNTAFAIGSRFSLYGVS